MVGLWASLSSGLSSPIGVMANPRDVALYLEFLSNEDHYVPLAEQYVSVIVNFTDRIIRCINELSSNCFVIPEILQEDFSSNGSFPLEKYVVDFGIAKDIYRLYLLIRKQAVYIENMKKIEGKDPYNYSILVFPYPINFYYPIMSLMVELTYRLGSNLIDIVNIIGRLKDPDNVYSLEKLVRAYLPYDLSDTPEISSRPPFLYTDETMKNYTIKKRGRIDTEFYRRIIAFASNTRGNVIIGIRKDGEAGDLEELLKNRGIINDNQPKIIINDKTTFYIKSNVTLHSFERPHLRRELVELTLLIKKNRGIFLHDNYFFIVPGLRYGDIIPKLYLNKK